MFELTKREKAAWNKKLKQLAEDSKKLETIIEEIKNNKIYEDAFEWRFEFPEVLDDDGDFLGFDIVIGNPPYVQLSKTKNLLTEEKNYLLYRYKTSGGRLNTFIFFTHLSSDILKYNGFLNYIIPNTILSQEYYSFTRDFLTNEVSLNEIVGFPILPFEDAVVETVLIQYKKTKTKNYIIPIKELIHNSILNVSSIKTATINRDKKYSFVYTLNPIIEKAYEREHISFGDICDINQGIALKGDKSLSLKDTNDQNKYYKLLDGRNINKYKLEWNGVYLDYDLNRIHSCKRKDIFESEEKLFFRRVSSSLIFTYDDSQYFALNTLIVVNKKDSNLGPNIKFILGLMNSKLMNYIYKNKFKSTKKVFSEIQARSVKELPVIKTSTKNENLMIGLVNKIIDKDENNIEKIKLDNKINELVYQIYNVTEEEIKIIEEAIV
jgi:tRNA1(Val) A37 N6-methylase TrmN6